MAVVNWDSRDVRRDVTGKSKNSQGSCLKHLPVVSFIFLILFRNTLCKYINSRLRSTLFLYPPVPQCTNICLATKILPEIWDRGKAAKGVLYMVGLASCIWGKYLIVLTTSECYQLEPCRFSINTVGGTIVQSFLHFLYTNLHLILIFLYKKNTLELMLSFQLLLI